MSKEKSTIFGEEHFIDNTMIELIETKNNVIDNMVFDEMEKSIRITLPFVKINAEKLRKWVILCMQLENIEHSELINIATKKKILDLQSELEELKKNAIVPKFKIGDEVWIIKRIKKEVANGKIIKQYSYFNGGTPKNLRNVNRWRIRLKNNSEVTKKEYELFYTREQAEEALRKVEEV